MRCLLDTNVCIDYLTGRFPSVAERLKSLAPDEVGVSSVVVAELRYGAEKSARPSENHPFRGGRVEPELQVCSQVSTSRARL